MSHLATTDDSQLPLFYNVSGPVGSGAFNSDEDVALVQFFLLKIYSAKPLKGNGNDKLNWTRPQGNLQVDGVFSVVVDNWIRKFQLDCRQVANIRVDGRVDRCLSKKPGGIAGSLTSSISRTVYTICAMNKLYIINYPADFPILIAGQTARVDFLKAFVNFGVAA